MGVSHNFQILRVSNSPTQTLPARPAGGVSSVSVTLSWEGASVPGQRGSQAFRERVDSPVKKLNVNVISM